MCALPTSLAPTSPADSDSPAFGAQQIRNLKQYIIDVLGVPNAISVTAAPFSITASGILTIQQSPLIVPTVMQGPVSQILQLNSQYSTLDFQVNASNVFSATATGFLVKQPFLEMAGISGATPIWGTQGSTNPLVLRIGGATNLLIGTASNMYFPGQLQAGAGKLALTNPTGMMLSDILGTTNTSGYLLQSVGSSVPASWVPVGVPTGSIIQYGGSTAPTARPAESGGRT